MIKSLFVAAGLMLSVPGWSADVKYPGAEPGPAQVSVANGAVTFSNNVIVVAWTLPAREPYFGNPPQPAGSHPLPVGRGEGRDVQAGRALTLTGEVFQVVLTDGSRYVASDLLPDGKPRLYSLTPTRKAAQPALRIAGKSAEVPLRSVDGRLRVRWRGILLDGSHYVRQEIELTAAREPLEIQEIVWLDITNQATADDPRGFGLRQPSAALERGLAIESGRGLPESKTQACSRHPIVYTAGQVAGSPIVADNFFFGSEDPMAENAADESGSASSRVRRNMRLARGESLTQSFVVGVAPAGQMRRAFLRYVERERAHPFRPLLHYNSWYDISWPGVSMNESNCLAAIRSLAEDFVQPHGVVLDGVLFDDGWDDPKTLWQFHSGFPRGFTPHAKLCRRYGLHMGVWLSPFGGYDKSKQQRLQYGAAQGYETNAMGFSLAGPKYYENFRAMCLRMIRKYGVNHFKFDGIASAMNAKGSRADYLRDLEALRRLMLDLRAEDPAVYINFTTGSWPSPFWLRYADSIWRGGGDMGFAGKGNKQHQWITYRDGMVCKHIVGRGPLFPLNSLMTQGVTWSRHGSAAESDFNSAGFKDDVRMFFGSGTSLQELYIQPQRLNPEDWRVLAEAAKWSRANGDVLVDTHWIGGDPAKSEVYGYASWSPRAGIIALRNPDEQPHIYKLDIGSAFELPSGAVPRFNLRSPWAEDANQPARHADAGIPLHLTLKPFEILVLHATPAN